MNSTDSPQRYMCQTCGLIYDESTGLPSAGIAPGTAWSELPADWCCPDCGQPRANFELVTD
ncbi:MAG: rubredoxin [Thauera sp.]|nr:rubredoxin [Thauera sp.]